jgi:hypothetical protein
MKKKIFYVYVLFRPWNGEPCYVGKGKGSRATYHFILGARHYNQHLAAVFKKAGTKELPCVILHEHLDETTAFAYEVAFIAAIGRSDLGKGPLCNQTDGGEGTSGAVVAEHTKKRASETHKGKIISDETRARLRASHLGQKPSRLAIERTRAANLGSKRSPETCAKIGARFVGKSLSSEHREKLRAARTGLRQSDSHRANISASLKGRPLSEEHKAKISAARVGMKFSEAHRASLSAARQRQINQAL